MKKLFYFLAAITLFVGCSDDSTNEIPESEAKITFVSDVANLVATQEATTLELKFNTTHDWTAKVDADWCSVEPFYGPKGDVVAAIKVAAYDGEESRQATVTIKAGAAVETFKVSQLPAGKIVVGEKNKEIGYEGGVVTISVAHNIDFTVEIEEAAQTWISEAPRALPTTDVALSVMANEGDARTGKVYIKGEGITEEVVISQAAWVPTFTTNLPENNQMWFSSAANEFVLEVNTNVEYDVVFEGAEWITMQDNNDNTYTFTLAQNTAMDYRSITGSIECDLLEEPISFAIFQNGVGTTLWSKSLTDLGFTHGTFSPMAVYGDYILIGNGGKILALNAADGTLAQTIAMPEGVVVDNLCVDEGGNILIAANTPFGYDNVANVMTIFKVKGLDDTPSVLAQYHVGNVYCSSAGNLRVAGNVDVKATIVFTAGVWAEDAATERYWVAMQAENGQVALDENGWSVYTYGPTAYGYNGPDNGCVIPVGDDLSDGLYFAGYGGDYNVYYAEGMTFNPKAYCATTWTLSITTGSSWMENYNSMALVNHNGNDFLFVVQACLFDYDRPDIIVANVNTPAPANVLGIYSGWYIQSAASVVWTNSKASDIVAVSTENGVMCYMNDAIQDVVACVKFEL